eukprot:CAMPEP_0181129912 /NCGR_PEP_ID=MMETSP1071-20121207/29577_1 /TAXON_ID=35127 /ORGANISM="Thalassiosira sp., Strain NH16" /LENGTH=114 /DNA_ID=CAMNT_0023215935 /DNA_START=182 /DNA_END=526 /DNA_ORIENTATION=+
MVAIGTVRGTGFHIVYSLYDIIHAARKIKVGEPMGTATIERLEEVQPDVISVRGHPRWIVSAKTCRGHLTIQQGREKTSVDGTARMNGRKSLTLQIKYNMKAYPLTQVPEFMSG